MDIDPKQSFLTDFEGMHDQHVNMLNVYNSSIKALLTVASLPVVVGGFILEKGGGGTFYLNKLPSALVATLLVIPVVLFVTTAVLIHYRINVLYYARYINKFRSLYVETLGTDAREKIRPLPIDPNVPALYELWGPMGLIVHGSGLIGGVYLGLGVLNVSCLTLGILLALVYFMGMEMWYRWNVGRKNVTRMVDEEGGPKAPEKPATGTTAQPPPVAKQP